MSKQKILKPAFIAFAAICMAIASSVFFHTDDELNQIGIGSPLGFGDMASGYVALWIQPWLIAVFHIEGFQSFTLSLKSFILLGACSGCVLAVILASIAYFWPRSFRYLLALLCLLTFSTSAYSVRNFIIMAEAQRHHHSSS